MITSFINAPLALIQWQNKLAKYRAQIEFKLQKIKIDLNPSTHQIASLTKKRLELVANALVTQKNQIDALLEPLKLFQNFENASLTNILAQRIPSNQHVLSYFKNIFRDWAWPTDENKIALQYVKEIWPTQTVGALVVLGSGAGRLSYDLALNQLAEKFVLIDINPLLLTISEKMWAGEEVSLTEINDYPISQETIAKKWTMVNKNPAQKNAEHIWGDAINIDYKNDSLEAILTPWFIDIIPEDFFLFSKRLNARLKNGGYWLNFGPLGFGGPERGSTYTQEEIKYILDLSGFKIEEWQEKKIAYLNSPLSAQMREETVILWRAKKIKTMVAPKDFSAYPEWMLDTQQAIPQLAHFSSLAVQSQLETQILLSIDGKRSIAEIENLMTVHLKMRPQDAQNLLLTFFANYFEM